MLSSQIIFECKHGMNINAVKRKLKNENNMKIMYVRTQFWFNLEAGGSVGHTLGILNGIKNNRCELFVVSNERFLGIENFNYSIIKPRFKRFPGELIYNLYAGKSFKSELLEVKPDFVYHRYTGYTFFVSKIAKKLHIPLILEFNSFDTWKLKHWGNTRGVARRIFNQVTYNIVKHIENYNLKNASLIVVVSQTLKTDLLKMGVPQEKILVNPNGVDINRFNPEIKNSEKCKALRQRLAIQNKVVIGFSGTFGPWHGIPQLTQTISNILNNKLLSDIHFLLIGDGELKSQAEKIIGNNSNVTFTGIVPYTDIQYYLAVCDILIAPHNPQVDGREFFGSPTKLFEYMAMGKGIVASRLGQIGEVLKHNYSAMLVEPGNIDQLTEGILALVKDKELRERLGKNAREDAINNYTWDRCVERILKATESLRYERNSK